LLRGGKELFVLVRNGLPFVSFILLELFDWHGDHAKARRVFGKDLLRLIVVDDVDLVPDDQGRAIPLLYVQCTICVGGAGDLSSLATTVLDIFSTLYYNIVIIFRLQVLDAVRIRVRR
jgi:hypothetical protein